MGAGKSTIGRALAREVKFDFYDSDEVIEDQTGADISWIFDLEGEAGFRKREQKVIEELTKKTNIVLATGGGAITIPENRVALAGRGTVIYLRTSLEQQLERTRRDNRRPLVNVASSVEEELKKIWITREPHYQEIADFSFDTDDLSVKAVTAQIIKQLSE